MIRVFAIGDVVGKTGVEFIRSVLPAFRRTEGVDLCVINGENAAVSNGITPDLCEELFVSGADVITTGNHVFRRKELYDYLDDNDFVLRPANFPGSTPGKGVCIVDKGRYRVGVVNLLGTVYMEPVGNPFAAAETALRELSDCSVILVDLHAEATSEKRAMGFFLDGKVSAVFGTHTHVPTADEQILPGGTAYQTDAGMTGVIRSVLGVSVETATYKMRTGLPVRFEHPDGDCAMQGAIVETDTKTGKALSIERFSIE